MTAPIEVTSPPGTADPLVFSIKAATLRFDTRDEIEPYLIPLVENPDVEEVHLSGNTYGIEACKFLGEILYAKKKLKVAHFADIFSTRLRTEIPQALSYLLDSIQNHPNLHTINLSDNAFGSTVQAPLIKFFSSHLPLEHVILANNGLGPEAGSNIANALASLAIAKSKHGEGKFAPLKTIICGRNRLGDSSMNPWATCFKENKYLETIRFPQNGIRPDGIVDILRNGIVYDTQLQILDLQDNTFTLKGALVLAEILPKLQKLKDLGVGDCLLSSRGGRAVAESLKKGDNTDLEWVRLQYNEIELLGAREFYTAARLGLPKLKMIEFNGNKFAEDDDVVEDFRMLFVQRGYGEMDELDDMEEVSEDEEENEEEDEGLGEDAVAAQDIIRKETEEEEDEIVPQEADKETDELADMLAKAKIDG